ncbi:MAG: thioredoxin domain-containing protein [Bdellovibrionales bacterium]|nr:thioredoxin domain-containing protein [Bdellovibrionales bacterium]
MSRSQNLLAREVSPYLLQHKDNPVWWRPWSEETFAEAKRLNLPVFLSVGYSTCYWCHVMEKESFESDEVASVLNGHFIAIKMDREERPDLDQIYMDALVGMTGRGGWPMSLFLTPDKQPFWAGTYIPKGQFIYLLKEIEAHWLKERAKIVASAERVTEALGQHSYMRECELSVDSVGALERGTAEALARVDSEFGGFGAAPKFPPTQLLRMLLRAYEHQPDEGIKSAISLTLERMAAGGIYDQVGGGFARYSTDEEWRVPHFEKMLYDNALLVPCYLEAAKLLGREDFQAVAEDTLHYLIRDMRDDSTGGYFAAEDAGEVGREGEYYLWDYAELKEVLAPDEFDALSNRFEITPVGNFEGEIVFHLKDPSDWVARFPVGVREKLFGMRSKRPRPHRDEKLLTAWNGLLLSAFVEAALRVGNEIYAREARGIGSYLVDTIFQHQLCTSFCAGERRGEGGTLDDYAYSVAALIDLFELTGEVRWLLSAREIQGVQDRSLWNELRGMYRYSSASDLIVERYPLFDGPLPNGNAVAMKNLLRLSVYFLEVPLRTKAESVRKAFSTIFAEAPTVSATATISFWESEQGRELLVVGAGSHRKEILERFAGYRAKLPVLAVLAEHQENSQIPLFSGKEQGVETPLFSLCEAGHCLTPTHDQGEIVRILKEGIR